MIIRSNYSSGGAFLIAFLHINLFFRRVTRVTSSRYRSCRAHRTLRCALNRYLVAVCLAESRYFFSSLLQSPSLLGGCHTVPRWNEGRMTHGLAHARHAPPPAFE